MNSDWKKEHDRAYGLLSKMLTRNFSLEFPKPGRDSNYLKTIQSTLDLRKTCAAKIHLQQKSDFCFHRCSPKMHFPKKMHNVRVRKYTRSNVQVRFPHTRKINTPAQDAGAQGVKKYAWARHRCQTRKKIHFLAKIASQMHQTYAKNTQRQNTKIHIGTGVF